MVSDGKVESKLCRDARRLVYNFLDDKELLRFKRERKDGKVRQERLTLLRKGKG